MNPCVETLVEVGVNRKIVGEEGAIDLLEFSHALHFAQQPTADDEEKDQHHRDRRPPLGQGALGERMADPGQAEAAHRDFLAAERLLAGLMEAARHRRGDLARGGVDLNFLIFISIFFIFVLAERKHTAIFHWMFTLYSLNLFEAIFCAFFKGKQRRKLQLLFLDVILIIRIIHLVFLP